MVELRWYAQRKALKVKARAKASAEGRIDGVVVAMGNLLKTTL
jgi:hypothetical protein